MFKKSKAKTEDLSEREIAAILAKIKTYRRYEKVSIISVMLFCAYSVAWVFIDAVTGDFIAWLGVIGLVGIVITWSSYEINCHQINKLQKELEDKTSHVGERYGSGKHVWEVIVNGNKHVITLETSWHKDTLMLDGHMIGNSIGITARGFFTDFKQYLFQIEGEPALLTSALLHGIVVIRLFVSGKQVE